MGTGRWMIWAFPSLALLAAITPSTSAALRKRQPQLPSPPPSTPMLPPQLHLPIACEPGKSCFVQQYFDHDPGPDAKDYRCGSRVYDGHDGVDIRLPTVAAQQRGVAVLAAADGLVTGIRDGVTDHLVVTAADRAAIKGKECGNGVVLTHADGWETQYCHLARGSVAAMLGKRVKAGDKLGLVGLSGDTQFPHLHFSVRQRMRKVDPFAPDAAPGSCSPTDGPTLWSPEAAQALAYHGVDILNIGFANGPVSMEAIEADSLSRPSRQSAALVGYGRAIGLRAGDRMSVAIMDATGRVLAENGVTVDGNKAQYMLFTGKKRPAEGWKSSYNLTVIVAHGNQTLAASTVSITP